MEVLLYWPNQAGKIILTASQFAPDFTKILFNDNDDDSDTAVVTGSIDCFHCHTIKINRSKTIQWKKLRNRDLIEDN